jgi:hypothetical protein
MSVNWEQLLRNGQLITSEPEHRVMLERFLAFFKGTPDEQMIAAKYPAFYAEVTGEPKVSLVSDHAVGNVEELPKTEVIDMPTPKKRKGRKPKLSPSTDAE